MYSRRRSTGPGIGLLILLGAVIGIGFLIYDNLDALPFFNNQPEEAVFEPVSASSVEESAAGEAVTDAVGDGDGIADTDLIPDIPQDTTLFIPSAGIYSQIVQVYLDGNSWDVSGLGINVGHLQGTPQFEEGGNVVLSGHVELADGRTGVFANLDELTIGDVIVVQQNGMEYTYSISEVYNTTPDDLTPLRPTTTNRLTLITCGAYDFFQDSYLERTIVVAELIG